MTVTIVVPHLAHDGAWLMESLLLFSFAGGLAAHRQGARHWRLAPWVHGLALPSFARWASSFTSEVMTGILAVQG